MEGLPAHLVADCIVFSIRQRVSGESESSSESSKSEDSDSTDKLKQPLKKGVAHLFSYFIFPVVGIHV